MSEATVTDDRITFPEDADIKAIRKLCGECELRDSCLGADSKGFADLTFPRGTLNPRAIIEAKAACLKERGQ